MGEVFFNPLDELADYQSLNEDLRREKGPVSVSGCMDSQKVHLMYEAAKDVPWKLVVTYDDSRAREIYDDFKYFRFDVWLYPAKDLLFYSSDIHGNLLTKQRMQVLRPVSYTHLPIPKPATRTRSPTILITQAMDTVTNGVLESPIPRNTAPRRL